MRDSVQWITRECPVTTSDVVDFMWDCIEKLNLGTGFDPHTKFSDYRFKNGNPRFTSDEAEALQEHMDMCLALCETEKADIKELCDILTTGNGIED